MQVLQRQRQRMLTLFCFSFLKLKDKEVRIGIPPKSFFAPKFHRALACMPINFTLPSTNKCGGVPEFHLLIICQEVKLDHCTAVLQKFGLASLSLSLSVSVLLHLALANPCHKAAT